MRAALLALPLALAGCEGWLDMGPDAPAGGADVLEVRSLEVLLDGLTSPTDIALAPDGRALVLDGEEGVLVVVPADGGEPERVAVEGAPVGLTFADGRVWLAHSTEPVVEALELDSGARQGFRMPDAPPDLRLTDVLVDDDGPVVIANQGGPWRLDVTSGAWTALPIPVGLGTPFLGATAGDSRLVVVDVANDRAVRFVPGSQDYQEFGKWGVWEACFVHPTGVAVDSHARLFLADALLGVVEVFSDDGLFLGSLGRDAELLRMEHPMGLAVAGDRLVVVDAGAGRVLSVELDDRTTPVTPQGMYERKVPRFSLLEGRTTPLSRVERACRSCHDGSVQPATRVWNRDFHQHPVGVAPEKEIPEAFPLDEGGQLYCGTCHIPHRLGDNVEAQDLEIFLREPRARSELCLACHPDVVAEVRHLAGPSPEDEPGHVVGDVPVDMAHSGPRAIAADVKRVECLDCHSPHGALGEQLLEDETSATDGCLVCHEGLGAEHAAFSHPVGEPLSDATALGALRSRGSFLGSGGEVTCLTCHDIHRSAADSWLTVTLDNHERCLLCHEDKAQLGGGGHDLRAGPEGHVATACLGCHQLHDARGPNLMIQAPRQDDPTGCLACHAHGAQAKGEVDPHRGHPLFEENPAPEALPSVGPEGALDLGNAGDMGCLTCHDPHANPMSGANEALLRRPGEAAEGCLACHPEERAVQGSDHDLTLTDSTWARQRGDEMAHGGFCLACHGMHDPGRGWRGLVSPAGGPAGTNASTTACLGCHQAGNRAGATVVRVYEHPQDLLLTTAKLPWSNTAELPLYAQDGTSTDDNQIGTITCLTCHDPHIWAPKKGGAGGHGEGDTQTSFLRDGWQGFCSGCHGEEAIEVYRYFHDPDQRQEIHERHQRRKWDVYREDAQ